MHHVPDGLLRRFVDEPLAVPDREVEHLERCERCRTRRDEVLDDAGTARETLVRSQPALDLDGAWQRTNEAGRVPTRHVPKRIRPRRLVGSTGVAVASGMLVAGVAAAATLTVVFSPTHVAPLPLSKGDLQSLSSVLGATATGPSSGSWAYGTVQWTNRPKPVTTSSLQAAESAAGLSVELPTTLPAGVEGPTKFLAVPASSVTVTFDAKAGSSLAGSTLTVDVGAGVLAEYGDVSSTAATVGGIPTMVVGAVQRPTATSAGATITQLESFVLGRSGFPSSLAQEVRLLGNLKNVLPVPVPSGMTQASTSVGSSQAVYVSIPDGSAGGVVWEHDHIVRIVGGLVGKQEVMDVARQLG